MASTESIDLIRRAKMGDRKAWDDLCRRYYPRWLDQFHAQLGGELRRECDTEDLVQSAMKSAFRDIDHLRNDGTFYAWVCAIIRHKIAEKARRRGKHRRVPLEDVPEPGKTDSAIEKSIASEEEYVRILDEIMDVFKEYPEPMAAVYLQYFEKMSIDDIMGALGKSRSGVHRLLRAGRKLLRDRLSGSEMDPR